MIKLTDEEIWEVDKTIPDFTKENREDPWYCERYYLKAQLKKVVDYLDTLEFYDDWGGESGKALRDHIKQALLDEVNDETHNAQ